MPSAGRSGVQVIRVDPRIRPPDYGTAHWNTAMRSREAGKDKAYSPDLNPIEKMFSKLKGLLRTTAARTVDGVVEAMGEALQAMAPKDFEGWFRSCGYCYKQS